MAAALLDAGPLEGMALQKLLYYVQGLHLAAFGTAAFGERIEAWSHGPVVPEVWDKHRGAVQIRDWEWGDELWLSDSVRAVIAHVLHHRGDRGARYLREATHEESPWLEARQGLTDGDRSEDAILAETMSRQFSSEADSHLSALANTAATNRLEGAVLDIATLVELDRVLEGETTADEVAVRWRKADARR